MRKGLRNLTGAVALAAAGAIASSTGVFAADQPSVKWTLDSWSPASGYQVPEWTLAVERIKQRTEGRFVINPVWNSGLGVKGQDALGALSKGVFQIECGPLNYWAGSMPILGVLGLPGLYSDLWENSLAKDMLEEEFLREDFSKNWNAVLVGPITIMPPSPVWTKEPIRSLADLKGKTIRGFSPEMSAILNAFGANVVSMPFPEVYSAAQRGVMQGAITSSVGARSISIWEVWPYATEYNFASTNPATLVNKKAYEELPAEYRAILFEEFSRANQRINYRTVEADKANWAVIEKGGLRRIQPTADDLRKFTEVAKPLWSDWAQKQGSTASKALDRVLALLGK
jgi:TRAP-type C4-dicarboxylate transport system substrate-binding protein